MVSSRVAGVAVFVLLFTIAAMGHEFVATDFACTGVSEGGLCWLKDFRLRSSATWRFLNVPQGVDLKLRLEGIAEDPCQDCVGRDVFVRIFYGPGKGGEWGRIDLLLRNRASGCSSRWYKVYGEASFTWLPEIATSELVIIVQRVILCDPHVGFTLRSLTLEAPKVEVSAFPPPQSPPPPPPPPPEECTVPSVAGCFRDFQGTGCPVPELPPADVPREELPDTNGPGEAVFLPPGDYVGHLGGPLGRLGTDFHDWYRLRASRGEALVFWISADPGLEFDVYFLNHCGIEEFRSEGGKGLLQCIAPCTGAGDTCDWYIRIVRKSGEGNYYLSLYPAVPEASP